MSSTQIVFSTDTALKQQTLTKLKEEGSTLKSLLQYAMKAYVQGRISLGIVTEDNKRTPSLEKEYQKKAKDFSEGKNIVERDDLVKKYA